jgi:hypothetical protein
MPHGLLPIAAEDAAPNLVEPQAVVEAFLAALMASDPTPRWSSSPTTSST